MSGSRIVVSVIVLVCAAVAGASSARADVAEIEALLAERKVIEAHEVATRAVAARPDDPDARYQAARTALAIYDRGLAEEHMARGLAVAPDHAPLLGLAAMGRLHAGELAEARALAERAVAADAAQADARDVLDQLQLVARARSREGIRVAQAGDDDLDPALTDGTAEAFVDRFVRMAFDGEDLERFVPMLDDELLSVLPREDRRGAGLRRALAELVAGVRESQAENEHSYLGWRVVGAEPTGDGSAYVRVAIPVEVAMGRRSVERALRALTDLDERRFVSPDAIAFFEAVPAEQRAALVERMVGTKLLVVGELGALVTNRGGTFALGDLDWNGFNARTTFSSIRPGPSTAAKSAEGGSSAGAQLAILLGITVVAGAALALIFARGGRRRRRRRAG